MNYTRTVNTYILNNKNQILLLLHKKLNKWLPPGGKIETNELTHEAAAREVMEETGLKIEFIFDKVSIDIQIDNRSSILPVPIFAQLEGFGEWRGEDFIYLAKTENDKIDNKENHKIGWFTIEDAIQLDTFENVKRHLDYIKNKYIK